MNNFHSFLQILYISDATKSKINNMDIDAKPKFKSKIYAKNLVNNPSAVARFELG